MQDDRKHKSETAKPFSEELRDERPSNSDHPNASPDREEKSERPEAEKTTQRTE